MLAIDRCVARHAKYYARLSATPGGYGGRYPAMRGCVCAPRDCRPDGRWNTVRAAVA